MNDSAENPNQGSDDGLAGQPAGSVQIPPPRSSDRRRRQVDSDNPRDAEVQYERAVASSAAEELARSSRE